MTRYKNMFSCYLFFTIVSFFLLICSADGTVKHDHCEMYHKSDAKEFINSVTANLSKIIDSEKSRSVIVSDLQVLSDCTFDTDLILKFIGGKAYKHATDREKKEFKQELKQYMMNNYLSNFDLLKNGSTSVVRIKPKSNNVFLVNTRFKGQVEYKVDYKVRKDKSGKWKIIEIIAENYSMMNTLRAEINANNNSLEHIIANLKQCNLNNKHKSE